MIVWASIVILFAPLSLGAAVYLWRLHARDRALDGHVHRPRVRLSLILAITGTISAVVATYLAIITSLRLFGALDTVTSLTPITVAALIVLDGVPIINALYLRWLDMRAKE